MANDVLIDMLASLSLDSGVVTSSADPKTIVLSDSAKNWAADKFKHCIVRIVFGKGVGQLARIVANSADSLLVSPPWVIGLDTSSVYVVYQPEVSGQVDSILAGVDTLLGRFTAGRAGYLDNLSSGAVALAANWTAALASALGNYTAARAGYLDELAAANIPADVDGLKTSRDRHLFSMDFWSNAQEEISVATAAATKTMPDVTVAGLPSGATVARAIAIFKFRMIENTSGAANSLNGATIASTSQVIQVRADTPGTWRDAIKFVDTQFGIAALLREGGDVLIGDTDVAVEVVGNDTYNFQWLLADANQDNLNFNDVQVGLRIWYSV